MGTIFNSNEIILPTMMEKWPPPQLMLLLWGNHSFI